MTRDEAIDKIRKCLALASSPVPAEAAAALRQAQRLAELHGIEMQEATAVKIVDVSIGDGGAWEQQLGLAVAQTLGLETWLIATQGIRRKKIMFSGPKGRVELAEYAHDVLKRGLIAGKKNAVKARRARLLRHVTDQVATFRKNGMIDEAEIERFVRLEKIDIRNNLRSFGTSYALGYASSVCDAVASLVNDEPTAKALAAHVEKLGLGNARSQRVSDYLGFSTGAYDGNAAGINRATSGLASAGAIAYGGSQ